MHRTVSRRFLSIAALILLAGMGCALSIMLSGAFSTRADAARMVDAFEAATGEHPGFRRNHAKGICISGRFDSNGRGAEWSHTAFLRQGSFPVIGRFSVAGGDPSVSDTRSHLRSLALDMREGNESWRMALNSVPVFFVSTPQALFEQLRAAVPDPGTTVANPHRLSEFRRTHPEIRPFEEWLQAHPPSSGFDNGTYYSVNAFYFTDAAGGKHLVRWRMEPETPYTALNERQIEQNDPDLLTYDLVTRLAQNAARWHLILTLALPGDVSNDATQRWSRPGHREIDAGVLVIDQQQSQIDGPCRDIDFNPLVLPRGIQPSDDPLLHARAAAYAESHRRRLAEMGGH
ncbi:catalase family peroxidase [Pseudomonas sp. X10]